MYVGGCVPRASPRYISLDHGVVQGGMGIRGFELKVRGTAGGAHGVRRRDLCMKFMPVSVDVARSSCLRLPIAALSINSIWVLVKEFNCVYEFNL